MGFTDLFNRGRSNVVLSARQFTLSITITGQPALLTSLFEDAANTTPTASLSQRCTVQLSWN